MSLWETSQPGKLNNLLEQSSTTSIFKNKNGNKKKYNKNLGKKRRNFLCSLFEFGLRILMRKRNYIPNEEF